jgi:hypothetical protein
MDDNHDTHKTAKIEINQLYFERLVKYLIFRTSYNLRNISLAALNRIRSPFNTFAPVKSFRHVSVRNDDKVYNCKTSFIHLLIVSLISKILNISICLKS